MKRIQMGMPFVNLKPWLRRSTPSGFSFAVIELTGADGQCYWQDQASAMEPARAQASFPESVREEIEDPAGNPAGHALVNLAASSSTQR